MRGSRGYVLALVIALLVLGLHPDGRAQSKGTPPVIQFAWAQERIRQGEDWRIYLSATDPEGDMSRIYCRIDQSGGQIYRQDITNVKKGMEGQLQGYLVLRTFSSQDFFGVSLTLTVVIADRAGNESKPVTLPLAFNGEGVKFPPTDRIPPDLAKGINQRIGYIGINLIRRDRMGGGD